MTEQVAREWWVAHVSAIPNEAGVASLVALLAEVQAERDEEWKRRGHSDGKGGCFYMDRIEAWKAEGAREAGEHRGCDCGPSGHRYADCPAYREGHGAGAREEREAVADWLDKAAVEHPRVLMARIERGDHKRNGRKP